MVPPGLCHPAHPRRLARLAEYERREGYSGVADYLTAIEQAVFQSPASPRLAAIAFATQERLVAHLIALDASPATAPYVRSAVQASLRGIENRLTPSIFAGESRQRDANAFLAGRIKAHLERPAPAIAPDAPGPEIPPGSPIGSAANEGFMETCWHCDTRIGDFR